MYFEDERTVFLERGLALFDGAVHSPRLVLFFPPEEALNVSDVAERSCLNRNRHLQKKGEDEEARGPDAEGYHQLDQVGHILVDFSRGGPE